MTTDYKKKRYFFSGIGGSGVSAIAGFMAAKGHSAAGSDRAFDNDPGHPLIKRLISAGIAIFPQDGSGITDSLDLAVFSTAVEEGNPEFIKAEKLGIPVMKRPDFLAYISAAYDTIAIAGTSGKSTAAGLLAFLMQRLGLEPNYIGGGRVKQFRSEANSGNLISGSSKYLVIEACESDGTIVNYRPQYSIILNLALDHHSVSETADMFRQLVNNTGRKAILNADDKNLYAVFKGGMTAFSIYSPSDYKAEGVEYKPLSSEFHVRGNRFSLSLPGEHNIYNALSCIALLSEIGVPPERISDVLPEFRGIERRFEIHLDDGENLVIEDYAHNPHKIAALMKTVAGLRHGICYIFQPHGFGPTRLMKDEYIEVFRANLRDNDRLILLPIYYTGGSVVRDISSQNLADGISGAGRPAEVAERDKVLEAVERHRTYVIFGARDESLSDFARQIADKLKKR
ncbi:MAG: hypothetical protein HY809_04015 [Nitrospirae bacterium]|nr:hypothetical protein [Nitrospirota bacterium]